MKVKAGRYMMYFLIKPDTWTRGTDKISIAMLSEICARSREASSGRVSLLISFTLALDAHIISFLSLMSTFPIL